MEEKKARLLAIERIIKTYKVESQESLLHFLEKEGYQITQATLSRDLKLLKVVKISDNNTGYYYTLIESNAGIDMVETLIKDFNRGFISIEFSGPVGVIKTLPGHASSVAFALDQMDISEIIGTIAGDDTILIILKEGVSKSSITQIINIKFSNIKGNSL